MWAGTRACSAPHACGSGRPLQKLVSLPCAPLILSSLFADQQHPANNALSNVAHEGRVAGRVRDIRAAVRPGHPGPALLHGDQPTLRAGAGAGLGLGLGIRSRPRSIERASVHTGANARTRGHATDACRVCPSPAAREPLPHLPGDLAPIPPNPTSRSGVWPAQGSSHLTCSHSIPAQPPPPRTHISPELAQLCPAPPPIPWPCARSRTMWACGTPRLSSATNVSRVQGVKVRRF